MFQYHCLNPIANIGLSQFDNQYEATDVMADADAILVRSAAMHDLEFDENVKVIARAGAGVNNIPLDRCAEEGIVVFNTPGANANGVKELKAKADEVIDYHYNDAVALWLQDVAKKVIQ